MSILRWMARISLAEWIMIGGLLTLLWRRVPQAGSRPGQSASHSWPLDACVAVAVIGILAGAIWRISWLSLAGFAAAALGIGLMVRGWGFALKRWFRALLGRKQ